MRKTYSMLILKGVLLATVALALPATSAEPSKGSLATEKLEKRGVSRVKWTFTGGVGPRLAHHGAVTVFWRENGFTESYKKRKYVLIGKVSGRSKWCGVTAPINNQRLHRRLMQEAARKGANALMLNCGYGGYQCYCYADALFFP